MSETTMIGKYVIVRCRDAGVHAGVLESAEGRTATLSESRRLWRWWPANRSKLLSGVAVHGILHERSILPCPQPLITLTETCEISLCTDVAEASIRSCPESIAPDFCDG